MFKAIIFITNVKKNNVRPKAKAACVFGLLND
jgi:hypothetical protein